MNTLFALDPALVHKLFRPASLARLESLVDIDPDEVITDFREVPAAALSDVEFLITGWGSPTIGPAELDRMPALRAILHAAGTVKGHVDADAWHRGIIVTTAASANARPVAEYTLAMILLAGKRAFELSREFAVSRHPLPIATGYPAIGNAGRTVGIVGASRIGRRVLDLLRPFDFDLLLTDPTISAAEARDLGATLVGLDELLERSSIVSLHAPMTPATEHMLDAAALARIPDGACLINTARGRLIDHDALRAELRTGRISAILDVTDPEPLDEDDVLYTLPNVTLTPHIAGAAGNELALLGDMVTEQLAQILAGTSPVDAISFEQLATMA
ncbi:hydroxyacid dehydrogenase [Microbacterium sp.]|uniref:hydroxyacid dehydrogenase n=1 Tax=Microbacterium sp. TaxID=51671 RepID=UPI003F97AE58